MSIPEYLITEDGSKYLDTHLTTCLIEYKGNNWWNSNQLFQVDLVLQLSLTIPIFETAYPDCQALFLFDNVTSHSAYILDRLRVPSLNLYPGGAQPLLSSGIKSLTGEIQSIVQLDSTAKGLQMVLQERGL